MVSNAEYRMEETLIWIDCRSVAVEHKRSLSARCSLAWQELTLGYCRLGTVVSSCNESQNTLCKRESHVSCIKSLKVFRLIELAGFGESLSLEQTSIQHEKHCGPYYSNMMT